MTLILFKSSKYFSEMNGPEQNIFVLIAYAQKSLINDHAHTEWLDNNTV